MKFSKADAAFTAVVLAGIAALSLLLYWHQRAQSAGSGEAIGKVFYKREIAMRKFADRLVWDNVESGTPLYSHDAVMTGNYSDAELVLNNGLRLKLEANTLIELDLGGEGINLKLEGGGIKTAGTAASATISTADGKAIRLDNAAASIRSMGASTAVEVNSGSAQVAGKDGKTEVVSGGEILSGAQKLRATLTLTGLVEDAVLLVAGKKGRVSMECSPGADRVEFAQTSDMQSPRTVKLVDGKATAELSPGDWYARCRGENNAVSTIRHFRVLESGNYRLFRPEKVTKFTNRPEVHFEFQPPRGASRTRIEIASDAQFASTVIDQTISGHSAHFTLPKAGIWYYRLSAVADSRTLVQFAPATGSFTLAQADAVLAFVHATEPVFPLNQVSEGRAMLYYEGSGSFRFTLRQQAGQDTIASGETAGGMFKLPPNLAAGKYELLLTSGSAKAAQRFTVRDRLALELISPKDDVQLWAVAGSAALAISWRSSEDALYQALLADDAGMKNVVRKEETSRKELQWSNLKPGTYYLRVLALKDNLPRAESKTVRIKIEDRLAPVSEVYPKDEQKVDVAQKGALQFRWQPVTGATAYEVRLLQKRGNSLVAIDTEVTKKPAFSFRNWRKLKEGELIWEVRALRTDDSGKIVQRSEPVQSSVQVSFGPNLPAPEVVPVVEE